ncbi:hypothetical protein QE152_g39077 [Popillia japonica]|uniref:Uncharacterized protein n=1 Tax=Popillia japonica TaxID=7064 RepID=A0AAW1HVT1_POPJA
MSRKAAGAFAATAAAAHQRPTGMHRHQILDEIRTHHPLFHKHLLPVTITTVFKTKQYLQPEFSPSYSFYSLNAEGDSRNTEHIHDKNLPRTEHTYIFRRFANKETAETQNISTTRIYLELNIHTFSDVLQTASQNTAIYIYYH